MANLLNQHRPSHRIWELDFFRSIAILLMVFFHLIYDLHFFYNIPIHYESGVVYYIGKASASLFIFLAGISCTLSKNNTKRGLHLLLWALAITVTTSIAVPGSNIIFGILHLLGVSILLSTFFQKLKAFFLILIGSGIMIIGVSLPSLTAPNNWLAPLGLLSADFYSADYYPLFPWFGLFLWGVAFGRIKYRERISIFPWDLSQSFWLKPGQHSLSIYLLHQPVLLLILYVAFKLT
ncbi:MAG: heparan-alpha-glucosaminide N-acetyltransferase [Clostridia bacterium]|uniref:Uncharacterized membrane protein n=1 Tax=Desulforamulus aeronauticus DSM 10349 TaxID=1121421 RepID=A0A1M6X6I4_9FIRM|nr:heparan-alpha-glucosaminide N-acetyltransferase [Desulforamulus aeronauticus]MDA8210542.1 heparan-alpha-glucosaminide N-acetyltransferase [Clostridia bacterium]SHL01607.1 Uncharacterized membrane protein [Desulforamulus aeronauticus DSM 10349]